METKIETHANAHFLLEGYNNGSDTLTKYLLGMVVTEGAIALAEMNSAYWFLDVICSHQINQKVADEEFQVWHLVKNKTGCGCKIICEDGNDNVVTTQRIPYTDFPFETATLWLCNNTILLPSEY